MDSVVDWQGIRQEIMHILTDALGEPEDTLFRDRLEERLVDLVQEVLEGEFRG